MSFRSKSCRSTTSTSANDQSVLEAQPRGGGYMVVSPDLVNYQSEDLTHAGSKSSCTCKGYDDDTEIDWEDEEDENAPSLLGYPTGGDFNVIGNLISVIMLLASGNTPDDFQLQTAADYLNCITDDDGGAPPNIQGLLNHIHMVMDESYTDAQAEEQEQEHERCEKIEEEQDDEEEQEEQ